MLIAQNITYKINKKTLLDNVSVSFEAGKLSLIIGPNGAGKSTLIKLLCNQISASNGLVSYDGQNNIAITELAKIRAVLSQNIEIAFPLNVREIVMMGRYPHFADKPTSVDKIACEEAMRFFDIYDMAERNYMTLSGGEKQRVQFARVMSQIWFPIKNKNRYLILDEPLTFLDVHYQFDFMRKLQKLLENKDIVIVGVVHDLNIVAKFADYIVLLHEGKVLKSGVKKDVLTPENIKTAYQIEPTIHTDGESMHLFFH